jgi:hypothetical protein
MGHGHRQPTPHQRRPALTSTATARRAPPTWAWLAVGVAAVSTSAPLIRLAHAPALTVALWRNLVALLVLAPAAWWLARGELRALTRRDLAWCALGGAALAAHFATWITSVNSTSVASSSVRKAPQPDDDGRACAEAQRACSG